MCRGQEYDNVCTMAGIRSGVQCRIKQVNTKAIFIPCANHSLNLAGVHAVASSKHSATFFAVVERVYSFFSASTQRWEMLLKHVPIVVKRVIGTRCSAHYEAVKALQHYFLDVVSALNELCDQNENIDIRGQARAYWMQFSDFSLFFLQVWMEVLRQSYESKYLQRRDLSLENCSHKMNAFIAFLVNDRDALVKQSIETAIKICEKQEIPVEEQHVRRKKKIPGKHAEDVGFSAVEEIKRCMLEAMDRFRSGAEKRFSEICMLNEVFGFLNPHALLRSKNIEEDINKFKNIYADDVNFSELSYKIARFNRLVQSSGTAF